MLRFIKNKAKRRAGSNVDLLRVAMPVGETLPADGEMGGGLKGAARKENAAVSNGLLNHIGGNDDDFGKSPLYEDPVDVMKNANGALGQNDEMGIDLDDLLKEVEKDLKNLTTLKDGLSSDAIYAVPRRAPKKPPRQSQKTGHEDNEDEVENEKAEESRCLESVEDDSDEEIKVRKKPRDPRRDDSEAVQSTEHLSRDSFIEGNHDVVVVKDGVPYVFPTSSDSGSEHDKPESERSYGRTFRIDPKNPYGLKEVVPAQAIMTTFAAETPVTVSGPLLLQDTNLLVASSDMPNMQSSVPIRNGSFRVANGNNKKVQFRDDSSVISNDETVKKIPIEVFDKEDGELVVIEEGVQEARKVTGDEDALSLGSEASDMSESDLRPRPLKIRRTMAILFAWICMGFSAETIGPNYPYLMLRSNSNYDSFSRAVAGRGAGFVVGAALGGLLSEALPYWLDLWAAAALVLSAVCVAAAPWCESLVHVGVTLTCAGVVKGVLTVAVLAIVMQIWDAKHYNLMVMALYAAYALGAAPAAELALLFGSEGLQDPETSKNGHNDTYDNGHVDPRNETTALPLRAKSTVLDLIPKSMYPFDIAALISFVGGAIFLVLFGSSVIASPRMPKTIKRHLRKARIQNMKPSKWFKGKVKLGLRTVLFLLAFFFLPVATEVCYGRFLGVYAEKTSLSFAKDMSAYVQVLFWGAVLLSRLLTPLTARCVAPNGLIVACLTTSFISTAVIIAYGESYPILFWTFSAVTGFFVGPVVPLGITWCNVYLNTTPMSVAVAMTMVGAGEALFSWLMGYIVHMYGPRGLLLYALGTSGVAFLLYLPVIPLLAKKNKWRFRRGKKVVD